MEDDRRLRDDPSIIDNPFLQLLMFTPPIHSEDQASAPGSILLDPYGYVSDRTNGTTAEGFTRDGNLILVTFWPAGPPRASCFTVHCPDLKPSAFGDLPKVISAEDDLVLLRVAICSRGEHLFDKRSDYFVYQAGTKNKPPSLKLVPTPPDLKITDHGTVLLRCRDHDMFFLATLRRSFINLQYDERQFNLQLYNSKTERWSTKLMRVDSPENFAYHYANKVITIGGELGSVGWVDLWRGILICDLLLDNHSLRYIPLPSPLVPKPPRGQPMFIRNIIVLKGCIKYFDMHRCSTKGWEATTMMMNFSNIGSGNSWEVDCTIKFSEVPVNSPAHAQMLPILLEGKDTEPTLKRLHASYPVLSLHDDDVVYIMANPNPFEDKASVIAVDMRNKTLKGVADFGSGRPAGYGFTFLQSGISKHLGIWSSTRKRGNAARGIAAETSRKGIAGPSGK
ncbi:uncharacterized protein LOC133902025 isoform X1 [Phragmites australis]|uniref:uncharacterized protein LOC133902025 isoform X1 n=1 Tax=Phragmites australis TaxID=29695 RepID=UPI002D790299|nr:uncharacterized protein LOC133902025 isoform X1 [Phragmites australis]